MIRTKSVLYIFIVMTVLAVSMTLYNFNYIYPSFTELLIKNIEDDAVRLGTHLADEYFHSDQPPEASTVAAQVTTHQSPGIPADSHSLIYTIQAGSFGDMKSARNNYDSITKELVSRDLHYLRIEQIGQLYTVRLGIFKDRSDAVAQHRSIRPYLSNTLVISAYLKDERIKKMYAASILPVGKVSAEGMGKVRLLSKRELSAMEDTIQKQVRDFNLMKMEIFNSSGETIYSTSSGDIGKINKHDYFRTIVAVGKPFTEVVKKDTRSLEGQTVTADVVETYVPVMSGGTFIGAFKMYYDITDRNNQLTWVMNRSMLIPLIILFFTIMATYVLMVMLDRSFIKQQKIENELKVYAVKLHKSNLELESFAHIASHDLQEPLRKVSAFGDRLKSRCAGAFDEKGLDYLNRMQNAAQRMQVLIEGLLTYSRVSSKARPFEPVDLSSVTKNVIGDLEERIQETGGQVEVNQLPAVEADPLQMRQLMQNLIGNALKFHKEGETPVISVSASIVNNGNNPGRRQLSSKICQITCSDNGIGFDEQYAKRIFGVFQRLHGKTEFEGSGIGLSVCKRIVERHGGSIEAKSVPEEGAIFIIRLPLEQPHDLTQG